MPDSIQKRALRTWHNGDFPRQLMRDHAVLGLVGEAGELADLHKKHRFKPGHESTPGERLDELGDVLYYVAILAWLDGVTIDELSQLNADKLEGGHGWQPNYHNSES